MDGVNNNHIVDIESILGKLIKYILVCLIPAVGLKVTRLVFRLSIIRGTDGGGWVALGHGICIGWPSEEQIYHLSLFLRIVLHSSEGGGRNRRHTRGDICRCEIFPGSVIMLYRATRNFTHLMLLGVSALAALFHALEVQV